MIYEVLQLDMAFWSNPRLPVLLYRGVFSAGTDDMPAQFEDVFAGNGWPPQWRNGVYEFHHFHSNAHEVLGFAGGSARLILGGPNGREISVNAGDAVLPPAGTGHFQIYAEPDFLVISAYPPDQQHFDICKEPSNKATTSRAMLLGYPGADPVEGTLGALTRHWHR